MNYKNKGESLKNILICVILSLSLFITVLAAFSAYAEVEVGEENGESGETETETETETEKQPDEKTLFAIEVSTDGLKTQYQIGDKLDVSGGKLTLIYSNDDREEIDLTEDMVKGFDSSKEGTFRLSVEYENCFCEYDIKVNRALPIGFDNLRLHSDVYDFQEKGGYVTGIKPGTKVTELLKNIKHVEYYGNRIRIMDGQAEIVGDPVIRTGMKVELLGEHGEAGNYERICVVKGDTNGDGAVTLTDMLQIAAHLEGKTKLKGVFEAAGKVTGKDSIVKEDLSLLKDVILGRKKLD